MPYALHPALNLPDGISDSSEALLRFPVSRFDVEPHPTSNEPIPDDEDVFSLGERCAEAFRQADILHYEGMVLLAEFDAIRGFEEAGFSSTAEWLAWRIGIKPGAARERVRTALALRKLPKTSAAMRDGALSFTKVRAVTRAATPENEEQLLEFAKAGSAANLERLVRGWKKLDRRAEVDVEQARFRTRTLTAFVDDDGMVVVRGRLEPEAGAMLIKAIDTASDALFRSNHSGSTRGPDEESRDSNSASDPTSEVDPGQRRADALGLIAERALAAGFTDGLVSGSRARTTQVVLHVDAATLSETGEPGKSELEDGTRVSAETSRRVACDTGVVRVVVRADGSVTGSVTGSGPRTRTVPPALRRALEVRDRVVVFRVADFGSRMRITSSTGPMEVRPHFATWCCCAGDITERCTRAG